MDMMRKKWKNDTILIGKKLKTYNADSDLSFPTFQYFKNGVFEYNYEGGIEADKFVNFMKSPTKEKASKPEKWQ